MKRFIVIALAIISLQATAQESGEIPESRRAEIESRKVAYITSALNLSPAEAQVFWPVYNAYHDDLKGLRSKGKADMGRPYQWKEKMNPDDIDSFMKSRFDYERRKVDLDEQYYQKFKTVLPIEKVAKYYEAEHEFRKEMMRSLRESRPERPAMRRGDR